MDELTEFCIVLPSMISSAVFGLVLGLQSSGSFAKAWEYAKARGSDALVVMVDGKVVYEVGDVDDKNQILASGTKSFCGTAMACAVQDQVISGWDEKLEVAIPEWKEDARGDITYGQLLGLNSGLDTKTSGGSFTAPPEAEILAVKKKFDAGRRFEYGPMPFNVFSLALERKLKGEKIQDYLERRVLKPLGIDVSYARINDEGRVQIAGMGRCSPKDWVKLGELWRNNGKLNGKLLWDAKTFSEVSKNHGPGAQYGLSFWLSPEGSPRNGGGASGEFEGMFLAAGAGKQLNIVIPMENAVVVRTGRNQGVAGEFSGNELLRLIFKE
ncbi:MAG: serine hydrolase domain-containing protein [Fimbriimonadaceae bacterium]